MTRITSAILAVVIIGLLQAAPDTAYELKGEAPGVTTLKQFKSNHKSEHLECSNQTQRISKCNAKGHISFAGVVAHVFNGCGDEECDNQGIFATFNDGLLVELTYGVNPYDEGAVYKALEAKFGEPVSHDGTNSAEWNNAVGTLSLTHRRSWQGPRLVGTIITSR